MSCHLGYRVTLDISINETNLMVLAAIKDWEEGHRGSLTVRALATEVGVSAASVRRSCSRLSEQGLLTVHEAWHEDGGRLANLYEVTYLGHELIAMAQEDIAKCRQRYGVGAG